MFGGIGKRVPQNHAAALGSQPVWQSTTVNKVPLIGCFFGLIANVACDKPPNILIA
ncbi:hypothetical protein RSSM_06608 [Rhodopirellula sallentina SM41]|uniref:Uncharacterized protein n=1 Tax=Rhodopirellula sallentina SM41 TaxID=1263870 RepID=M5TS40_9BACT|nr:hypothetical protein RSSM_06608 [Rhodopirellula sallentina SM41]